MTARSAILNFMLAKRRVFGYTLFMRCPICSSKETKVVDSRLASDALSIRRRRECEKCSYRFSTVEETELLDLTVVKRDGRREPYAREKIISGLRQSLQKRPYTADEIRKLVGLIERDIQRKRKAELRSREIGEVVMARLRHFDKVAYIRFASVYRAFEDVRTFERELRKLQKERSQKT